MSIDTNMPTLGFLELSTVRLLLADIVTPLSAPQATLGLFAGLRRREAENFDCEDVCVDSARRRIAGILVTGRRGLVRYVSASSALHGWLSPYLGMRGPIVWPTSLAHRLRTWARRHGLRLTHSTLRRTYATCRLASTRKFELVALEIGWNLSLWSAHMVLLPALADADAYFDLTPEACGRPGWAQEVAAWRSAGCPVATRPRQGEV